ncbi:MAG: A/G-specific adenine glycosylase, partial [Ferruginibacter sp.]
ARLLKWNRVANGRKMPWKGEKSPYKIWLSEIILQQTRVLQGEAYYRNFINNYPTVQHLAAAKDEQVFKLWEGLGYYTRCKNMLATARFISTELNGVFPANYLDLLKLKGVGPYTAAAIASFAYNLPHAVVDGNVYRVLSRFFGMSVAVDSVEGKKIFAALANELIPKTKAASFNQAIMDFGAVICKPQPACPLCPLKSNCVAFKTKNITGYPIKIKKIIKKTRWFNYLVIQYKNAFYIRQRLMKDIWQQLHEFILVESLTEMSTEKFLAEQSFVDLSDLQLIQISPAYIQQLTHQTIKAKFFYFRSQKKLGLKGYVLLNKKEIARYAFPQIINEYFKSNEM